MSKRRPKKLSATVSRACCLTDIFFPFFGGGISCKRAMRVDSNGFKQLGNWEGSWEDTSLMTIIDSGSKPVRRFPIFDQHYSTSIIRPACPKDSQHKSPETRVRNQQGFMAPVSDLARTIGCSGEIGAVVATRGDSRG